MNTKDINIVVERKFGYKGILDIIVMHIARETGIEKFSFNTYNYNNKTNYLLLSEKEV